MKKYLGIMFFYIASQASAAECKLYEHPNRGGAALERNDFPNANDGDFIGSEWNDKVTSVWVADGTYLILSENLNMGGRKLYVYGTGWAFLEGRWILDKGKKIDNGAYVNLNEIGFDDITTSFICIPTKIWNLSFSASP